MAQRHGGVFGAFAYLQATSLYNNVRQRLKRFVGGRAQYDDMTLLALRLLR